MPKIILTNNQWARLSEILGNLGLVFFGAVVLPYILDKPQLLTIITGLMLSFTSWILSMLTARKAK